MVSICPIIDVKDKIIMKSGDSRLLSVPPWLWKLLLRLPGKDLL